MVHVGKVLPAKSDEDIIVGSSKETFNWKTRAEGGADQGLSASVVEHKQPEKNE